MKILRRKWVIRSLSLTLILLLLESTFLPTLTLALTHGPHQPEYTSYEEPGSQDMVNLLTGDFNFSIPVLELPGPEGNFTLPLFYQSGIGLEQQSSWTGLGWNINPGAIVRNIVEYPDDAQGESYQIHRENDNISRGWRGSIPGIGQVGWDVNIGYNGTVSLLGLAGFSFAGGSVTGGNLMGVHFNSESVQVDPVGMMSAIITVATFGAGSAATTATETTKQSLSAGAQIAMQVGIEAASTAAIGVAAPQFNLGGYWQLSQREQKRFLHTNYWVWLDQTRYEDMYGTLYLGNMPVSYNLASGETPTLPQIGAYQPPTPAYVEPSEFNDMGATSDMYYYWDGTAYQDSHNPSSLAKDNYAVMGTGISGVIEPYRLDVGSLSMPRSMTEDHKRIALNPFQSNDFINTPADYKVQFKYKGLPSNNHYHHVGGTPSGGASYTVDPNDVKYGVVHQVENPTPLQNQRLDYDFDDPILDFYHTIVESDRQGLNSKKLSQSRQVQWFTNQELLDGTADMIDYFAETGTRVAMMQNFPARPHIPFYDTRNGANRFIVGKEGVKFFQANDEITIVANYKCSTFPFVKEKGMSTARVTAVGADYVDVNYLSVFRCDVDNQVPSAVYLDGDAVLIAEKIPNVSTSTIGGFKITNEAGLSYHYSLPIFEWDHFTHIQDVNDADNITTLYRPEPFPNTWLLTAITGPDYLDRDVSGDPDGILNDYDWGHWIKFCYGRSSSDYLWRAPYQGVTRTSDNSFDTYSRGKKQQYYLNTIETRSHVALFAKDIRTDGKSAVKDLPACAPSSSGIDLRDGPSYAMKLDEIILLKKSDYHNLQNQYSFDFSQGPSNPYNDGDDFTQVLDQADLSPTAIADYIKDNAVNRVKFHYDYSLCEGTYNSFDTFNCANGTTSTKQGKLTLKKLSFHGQNDFKVMPDYEFAYGMNAAYSPHRWDGWGMYNPDAGPGGDQHEANQTLSNTDYWNLTAVKNPMGSTMNIEYERDEYRSIAGINQVADKKGGNVRVASIEMTNVLGESFKTRYIYTLNGLAGGISSGVISREPDYIQPQTLDPQYDFYHEFDWPSTPVMYSRVDVLQGNLSNDTDYHTRQVYAFETPHHNMIQTQVNKITDKELVIQGGGALFKEFLSKHNYIQDINTSKIGRINSIKTYDKTDNLKASTAMEYTENISQNQGLFTEGTLMFEKNRDPNAPLNTYHRAFRTTKKYHPSFLKKVTTVADGFTSTAENMAWDFILGSPTRKITEDPLGMKVESITVPAYHKYPQMGPLTEATGNTHRLGQVAANYSYKLNAANGRLGLVGASAQTWQYNWNNYREVLSGSYVDGDLWNHDVWRKRKSYVWKGEKSHLLTDGTYNLSLFSDFDFTNPSANALWQDLGSYERFDHYSKPVDIRDLYDRATAVRMDNRQLFKIAEAGNANYKEIAFSGAETTPLNLFLKFYLESEIRIPNGISPSTDYAHTGSKSLKLLNTANNGFYYLINHNSADGFSRERSYRANVWVHNINSGPDKAELYYTTTGGAASLGVGTTTDIRAGDWHLLELIIPAGDLANAVTLEVGCRWKSGTRTTAIYLDDFRFQPLDAGMTAYVYNTDQQVEYVLNNDNLYTRYEYNQSRQVKAVYGEVLGEAVKEKIISKTVTNYGGTWDGPEY